MATMMKGALALLSACAFCAAAQEVKPAQVWSGDGFVTVEAPRDAADAAQSPAPQGAPNAGQGGGQTTDASSGAAEAPQEGIMPEMGPWLPIPDVSDLPCPRGWTVRPNPSVHNSLSYIDDSGNLAVSVTSIRQNPSHQVDAENYARVAAAQLHCDLPAKSNLIVEGWGFTCPDEKIEALVYGDPSNLVLVAFAGVNSDTEPMVEDFVRFLIDQAARR